MTTPTAIRADVDAAIQQMVQIIVDGWDPEQIILFGSRARGDYHEHSDVDLVVIFNEATGRADLARQIKNKIACTGKTTDIIISTPPDMLRRATVVGTVERAAISDGRTLHLKGRGDPIMERYDELMQRAYGDIRMAEAGLALDPPELFAVCYHAQQAIEKAVKAALMVDRIDYPFVHDLERLIPNVPIIWDIDGIVDDPKELSTWATYPRYMLKEPTAEFAAQALADARLIHQRVRDEIARRGLLTE